MVKHGILFFFFGVLFLGHTQELKPFSYIDLNLYSGNIARHNQNITHLIQAHPNGLILGWNKRVSGEKSWHKRYNYPEFGTSISIQNFNNSTLGNAYGLHAHYNFYFLKRRLMLRIAQGVSLVTNPYDKYKNPKNIAFGSPFLSGTYLMLNYKRPQLLGAVGVQAGITLLHLSNASIKAPNTSINTIAFNFGLTAAIEEKTDFLKPISTNQEISQEIDQSVHYGAVFKAGINQSDVVGSPQFPFYVFSFFADKQINEKSLISIGTEYFNSKFLKEYIYYQSIAYPESQVENDVDYKRVGFYLGYELLFGRFSVLAHLGYYVYAPFDFEGRYYNRLGMKHFIAKKWFISATLKAHAAKAEALEFGIGLRL